MAANLYPGGISSCNSYQWYWVSWSAGTIALGQGEMIGANMSIAYSDPETNTTDQLAYFGISTTATVTGNWIFSGCYYNGISLM